jgi:hypothetical protein
VEERRGGTLADKFEGIVVGNNKWLGVDKVTKGLASMVEVG